MKDQKTGIRVSSQTSAQVIQFKFNYKLCVKNKNDLSNCPLPKASLLWPQLACQVR